jgi:hypothetical protein
MKEECEMNKCRAIETLRERKTKRGEKRQTRRK